MEYEFNEEAETTAEELVEKYHPHLTGLKIAYLFKQRPDSGDHEPLKPRKALRYGKKNTLAKARLVSKIYGELLRQDYKFIIEFDRELWDELSLEQQAALVDHELSPCGNDADGCYLKHHDLEEFRGVVERHGLWKSDIEAFAETLTKQKQQPRLPLDSDAAETGVFINSRAKEPKRSKKSAAAVN
jgi:predicted metallopeptidase